MFDVGWLCDAEIILLTESDPSLRGGWPTDWATTTFEASRDAATRIGPDAFTP